MPERDLQHPVWNVYDQLRTARLNVLYYSERLHTSERLITIMQIILAASVPSSAIAGFKIWDFWLGKYAWEIFVSLSSLVAFFQPFFALPKKAKKFHELVSEYTVLYYDLQEIKQKIEEDRAYTAKHRNMFKSARERRKRLEVKEAGIKLNIKLRSRCQETVKREMPAANFYIPQEN